MKDNSYKKMLLMLVVSFVIMYGVMFLNVDNPDHIYLSMTRFYMALLMVSPMALLMLMIMGDMYKKRKLNIIIGSSSILVFILALVFLRQQTLVSDEQYMKAMIPHHSSAIMTSKNAALHDPHVKELSQNIIASQEREIRLMKELLREQDNKR